MEFIHKNCINYGIKIAVIPREEHFPYAKFCGSKCRKEFEDNPENQKFITWCKLVDIDKD